MNSVPEAEDEIVRTAKNTPVHLAFTFRDANDDTTELLFVQKESNGVLGSNTYTPIQDFEGADVIIWKVTDGKHESNVAITTILVGAVGANVAPVAIDRTVSVTEETPIRITVTCVDANGDPLFYQLLEKPKHGQYQWIAPDQVIYTPTVDFVGIDSFTFRSHDGQATSNESTITLTVGPVNDAPVALTQQVTTTRNANVAIQLFATDAESDTIRYSLLMSPAHGLLSGVLPDLLYTPGPDYIGGDSFQFQASDVQGATSGASVHISVQPSNSVPVAASFVVTTDAGSAVAVNLVASDADSDPLGFTLLVTPTHGLLAGEGADWVYTPAAGFVGSDSLIYMGGDGLANSVPATITLNVTAAPVAASLFGIVFDDANKNGQADVGETGVNGLRVTLASAVQRASPSANFTTETEAGGAWRLDGIPLGQYILSVATNGGVQLQGPVENPVVVGESGLQQTQPTAVIVTNRPLYLPVVGRP